MSLSFPSKPDTNILTSQWYKHAHAKEMPLRAIARLIQTMLYAKRFFPYYVYNILGGIEEDGLSSPLHTSQYRHPHSICQELVLSTLLIPSGHMSARLAELPVLLNPSFNLSSMARQVSFLHLFHFQFRLLLPLSRSFCLLNTHARLLDRALSEL